MWAKRTIGGGLVAALLAMAAGPGLAQSDTMRQGLMVVYGALSPTREGDTDNREQVFFSVPADLRDRIYVRVYDPEVHGAEDFVYGGTGDSITTYRVFGGDGAFTAADRPEMVNDGDREPQQSGFRGPVTGPGKLIREVAFDDDPATDARWVNIGAVRAGQGEIIDGRAYFRIDVQGADGNDGNGYLLDVSLQREKSRAPKDMVMFAYSPTVRWARGNPATRLLIPDSAQGPFTIQSFDAANGEMKLVTDYYDLPVRVSGQDFWASDIIGTRETNLALSMRSGFELPNDVTLAVFDAMGEPVPLTIPPYMAFDPARPDPVGAARPLADCRTVAFDGSRSAGRTPLSYIWDFGDGGSTSEPVIAYRYDQPGRYTARLRVLEEGTLPGRGNQIDVPVHVRNAPVAEAGDPITVAPGERVVFDGSRSQPSDSPITSYQWNFGDGWEVKGQRVEAAYELPGTYRAVLRVGDGADHPCNSGTDVRVVTVNSAPVAVAGVDKTAQIGQVLQFDGASSYDIDGTVTAYVWDMGDGTTYQTATLTHTYAEPGLYEVVLRVTDDSGVSNAVATDRAMVAVNAPPEPVIADQPRPLSIGEAAILDASASRDIDGNIVYYAWDFGDGATGEGQIASYAWGAPGIYTVTLTVTDDSGSGSASQSVTSRVVVDAAPIADAGADQFVTVSEVVFDGGGSADREGEITSYEWDLGDGTRKSGQVVRHAYADPGEYVVALVVRDDSGAPLNTDRDRMTVTVNAAPIADAGPAQTVAPGDEVIVSGRASVDPDGEIARYSWVFPDGTVKSGVRAAHVFTGSGTFPVRLTVQDDFPGGPARDEAEVLITVNAPPVAQAGADVLIAPGDVVDFDARASFDPDGSIGTYRWAYSDGAPEVETAVVSRSFDRPGTYSAQLIVTDNARVLNSTATDDRVIRVNTAPVAEAGASIVTDSLYIELDGSGSGDADGDALVYRWDVGDGSPPLFGEKILHVYEKPGVYPVTLTVADGTGVANERATDATTVTIRARPVADAGGNRDVCSGESILFDASDSVDPDGGLLRYVWDFGDGTTSDLINPTKIYEAPGTYEVTLQVENESQTASGIDIDRIAALVREGPIANAGEDKTVCMNQLVRLDGSQSTDPDGAVNDYSWTYGDGGTGRGATPVHIFRRPGTYTVTLSITGDPVGNCSPIDTDTAQYTVVPAPQLEIESPGRAAAGVAKGFAAVLREDGGAVANGFSWDFGDGTTAEGTEVSHVYEQPGEYLVTLYADIEGGHPSCGQLELKQKVIVNAAPVPVIDGPELVAAGQTAVFDAGGSHDDDGAVTAYRWDFGDGNTGSGVITAHRFAEAGVYDLSLTVVDDADAENSVQTLTQQVSVDAAPVAGLQAPAAICPGEPVSWSVAASENTSVRWSFGDGSTAEGAAQSHAFAEPGLYPVRVTMDNGLGLPGSQRSEEVYARVNATPVAIAGPDRVVCPGDVVVFDGSGSADSDGDVAGWTWEFSDGVTLDGQRVERRFDSAGDISVRLIARDDSGSACSAGEDMARVLVNAPPHVSAGPDVEALTGGAHDYVWFDASDAEDPDGHGVRLNWDLGDGTSASGARVRHKYATPGTYTVTVRAADTTGLACGVSTDTTTVTVGQRGN